MKLTNQRFCQMTFFFFSFSPSLIGKHWTWAIFWKKSFKKKTPPKNRLPRFFHQKWSFQFHWQCQHMYPIKTKIKKELTPYFVHCSMPVAILNFSTMVRTDCIHCRSFWLLFINANILHHIINDRLHPLQVTLTFIIYKCQQFPPHNYHTEVIPR